MNERACAVFALVAALGASACGSSSGDPSLQGEIRFQPSRPSLGTVTSPPRYDGSNATVLDAQERLTTGFDLHQKVVFRTCGPTGGVCHNSKEYPDLHTPANFLDAVDAPCNVQSGTPEAVFDRCEQPGDRLQLGDRRALEIGHFEYIPGAFDPKQDSLGAATPGLHLYLAEPISDDVKEQYTQGKFIRTFVTEDRLVEELVFFRYETSWTALDDGSHLFARVQEYQAQQVQQLLTVGLVEGDANRNGTFGARTAQPLKLIEPGSPETSYLVARIRGTLLGEDVPGTRMPLANQPLDTTEMLGLFCFIQGLSRDVRPDLASPIDYQQCSYSANPEDLNLLGAGVTWASRIQSILEYNCGGCHSGASPQGGLNLVEGNVYSRLLGPSVQNPDVKYIEPGDVASSYLWLKVASDPSIVGSPMPIDSSGKPRSLSTSELNDLRLWIEAGATENQ
jgi:hypothetical protein